MDISKLIPYVNNSMTHSPEQVRQIAASIREFGFTNPVIIDEKNGIIAGHGRVLAGQLLELKQVPVIQVDGWTEARKKAYVILDNQLARNAAWDEKMLALEIEHLVESEFDVDLLGFPEDELVRILQLEEEQGQESKDNGEPAEVKSKNFTVTIPQDEFIEAALLHASDFTMPTSDIENKKGCALTYICQEYLRLKRGK